MAEKIAGVVVLYHPTELTLESIESYIGSVSVLYAVDNSETADRDIVRRIKNIRKVKYTSMRGNRGIAAALNHGAKLAIQARYGWLLTMDQDSVASKNMVSEMMKCAGKKERDSIGILSANHVVPGEKPVLSGKRCDKVLVTMTSGNLLNLSVFQKAGPFREDFFIDSVDHEYCLRLRLKGFSVTRANRALLDHPVGRQERIRMAVQNPLVTNHSPLRRYYITRNRLFLNKMYGKHFPRFCFSEILENWKDLGKILLFEKEKFRKVVMIVRAYIDFLRGRAGQYGK